MGAKALIRSRRHAGPAILMARDVRPRVRIMVFLLLLLGFFAIAAGALALGMGLPAKDTTFGAAALVSASIAVTGGLILLGMALAVAELRRVLRGLMRQMRQDRIEAGGRSPPDQKPAARYEPRLAQPQTASGNVADVIPARFDALPADARTPAEPASGGELRRAPAGVAPPVPVAAPSPPKPRRPPDTPAPRFAEPLAPEPGFSPPPSPQPPSGRERFSEPRFAEPAPSGPESGFSEQPSPQLPAAPEPAIAERFDTFRIRDRRNGGQAPQGDDEARPADAGGTADRPLPPLAAAPGPGAGAARPVRILKSGIISEVAYTLFSDGTIETKTPDGTLHFSSIDEFRRHLENNA